MELELSMLPNIQIDLAMVQDTAVGVFGLGLIGILAIFLLVLLIFGFWMWMLVDCLLNEPSEGNDKLIWAAVIFFGNWPGAMLYYFLRRPQRIRDCEMFPLD